MSINVADIEKTAQTILQGVIDHEGLINIIAGSVGILPEVAIAEKALPLLVGTLQFLQQETGGSLISVFGDLLKHLTPGQPDIPALGPTGPQDPQASTT